MSIYVHPDAWGQGWGRQLMAATVTGLADAGFGRAVLWVLDSNQRARRFYRAAGWSPDGAARPDTIGGAEVSEVRYRRSLPSAPGRSQDALGAGHARRPRVRCHRR